jgi:hypothetical protein
LTVTHAAEKVSDGDSGRSRVATTGPDLSAVPGGSAKIDMSSLSRAVCDGGMRREGMQAHGTPWGVGSSSMGIRRSLSVRHRT